MKIGQKFSSHILDTMWIHGIPFLWSCTRSSVMEEQAKLNRSSLERTNEMQWVFAGKLASNARIQWG